MKLLTRVNVCFRVRSFACEKMSRKKKSEQQSHPAEFDECCVRIQCVFFLFISFGANAELLLMESCLLSPITKQGAMRFCCNYLYCCCCHCCKAGLRVLLYSCVHCSVFLSHSIRLQLKQIAAENLRR